MMANSTSSFDIDLFFIVLEQFRKYNIVTKRIFLTQIHIFLKNHQKAFMMVFEENQSTENLFKKKLLSFFFMIITECITSADNEISLFANNILIEVLYFQLMQSHLDAHNEVRQNVANKNTKEKVTLQA